MSNYRNVYVSDGTDETEIDNIVVTNSGIIVLEIKSAKTDITIAEDGRLLHENEISFHNVSMGDKMGKKRALLKYQIETIARERGYDLPVHIDSYIVFSTPYNIRIKVTDLYHQEKYCFRGKLNYIIDGFNSEIHYNDVQLAQINDIIGTLASRQKTFSTNIDFEDIKTSFAYTAALLLGTSEATIVEQEAPSTKEEPVALSEKAGRKSKDTKSPLGLFFRQFAASAAMFSLIAVATTATTAIALGAKRL
jgi:hypothetical protein